MKRIILFAVTTLVLFGISFGVSFFVQRLKTPVDPAGTAEKKDKATEKGAPAATPKTTLRPPFTPGAEEAVKLVTSANERHAQLREEERKVHRAQERLKLVEETVKGNQKAVDALRDELRVELEKTKDAMGKLEKLRAQVDQERQKTSGDLKDMQGRILELDTIERKNFEKMASMYDTMSPESAAKILEQMADTGKMDTAVKLLGMMKERNAAKVLAELTDPKLAAQLLERLKSLKRAPTSPTTPPTSAPAPMKEPLPLPSESPEKGLSGRVGGTFR